MTTPRFDLVEIFRIIERRKRFILTASVAALVLGAGIYLISKKKYTAKAAFFVANPIYTDRSSIFAGADSRYTDYFGGEDDIDRVIALSESDSIMTMIIRNTGYDAANKLSLEEPKQNRDLKRMLDKNMNIKRTEYKLLELSFTDPDPEMAAKVANEAMKDIELGYRGFYNSRKQTVYNAINNKVRAIDSSIRSLTDTLAHLREVSGIYDIISPTRANLVINRVQGNGKDIGRYMEVIQNYESVKDMLVTENAKYLALLNQYSTGTGPDEIRLLHPITTARPPVEHSGPGIILVALASFFVGLFFSIFYVLITAYYREVIQVKG